MWQSDRGGKVFGLYHFGMHFTRNRHPGVGCGPPPPGNPMARDDLEGVPATTQTHTQDSLDLLRTGGLFQRQDGRLGLLPQATVEFLP